MASSTIQNILPVARLTVTGTTDSDGDLFTSLNTATHIPLAAFPDRTASDDGYYSNYYAILLCGTDVHNGQYNVKCVNDNNQNLANTKVKFYVYYIPSFI